MTGIHLLLIDPQNDFCDLPTELCPPKADQPGERHAPALPVPGAHADMVRTADWIRANGDRLDAITVTMDHHHRLDIAHPPFWRKGDGTTVDPFTTITAKQVRTGEYVPAPGIDPARVLAYLDALEATERFTHMVWPIHCQIGTWGQCVHPVLQKALDIWEDQRALRVTQVLKGENPWTEQYSALAAEIPDPTDPATDLNQPLLDRLTEADLVLVAGEAGSHCVRATVEHIAANERQNLSKIVLLKDAMSPVAGFEMVQEKFFAAMAARGVRLETTTTVFS